MFNFDYITEEDIKEQITNWKESLNQPYRILILEGSGSGKTNALLDLINHELILKKCIYMLNVYLQENINN